MAPRSLRKPTTVSVPGGSSAADVSARTITPSTLEGSAPCTRNVCMRTPRRGFLHGCCGAPKRLRAARCRGDTPKPRRDLGVAEHHEHRLVVGRLGGAVDFDAPHAAPQAVADEHE